MLSWKITPVRWRLHPHRPRNQEALPPQLQRPPAAAPTAVMLPPEPQVLAPKAGFIIALLQGEPQAWAHA